MRGTLVNLLIYYLHCIIPFYDHINFDLLTQNATLKIMRPHLSRPSFMLFHSNNPCLAIVINIHSNHTPSLSFPPSPPLVLQKV